MVDIWIESSEMSSTVCASTINDSVKQSLANYIQTRNCYERIIITVYHTRATQRLQMSPGVSLLNRTFSMQ